MKLSRKQAEALGIVPAKAPRTAQDASGAKIDQELARKAFLALCEAHGVPGPISEYQFAAHLGRRWRFDWLWDGWLALEVQGGIFGGGRHTRGPALLKEMEKLNAAVALGYSVVFCTPRQLESGEILPFIKHVLEGEEGLPNG